MSERKRNNPGKYSMGYCCEGTDAGNHTPTCRFNAGREQPAQGEPRIDKQTLVNEKGEVVYRPAHPEGGETCTCTSPNCSKWHAGAVEGMSAEQFLAQYPDNWVLSISEQGKSAIAAFAEAYAALKVREYEKGLLPRVDDTLIACNREIAKLREERDGLITENSQLMQPLIKRSEALAEARDKALDEAAATTGRLLNGHGCSESLNDLVVTALLALKGKR